MLAELPLLARYTPMGAGAVYAIPFRVYRAEDVAVTFSTNGRTETALTLGKDYSVQILPGGGAELTLASGVVPAGAVLAIASAVPATQEADLSSTATVDTAALETQLDREVQMIQQLEEGLGRAVKLAAASNESPEELLEDIFTARDEAVDSASSARASANAAGNSALAAAGSAAIATEEREAACICAQESRAARDAAIAQAEAANTLMEAEIAKVNAIVAANRTDQQAAVTAARQWAEKAPDMPVEYDEAGNAHYSAQHWAERAQKLANNPDGETITVDADGVLKALGGNLQLNRRVILKESGTWTVPVTGWYNVTKFNGGSSGAYNKSVGHIVNGPGWGMSNALLYLTKDMEIPYVIGAGGASPTTTDATQNAGGATTFGEFSFDLGWGFCSASMILTTKSDSPGAILGGGGLSGGPAWGVDGSGTQQEANAALSGRGCYGGGGAATRQQGGWVINGQIPYAVGAGAQGCIIISWFDPDYAAGPGVATEPAVALMSARRMARTAAAPATVNLYDPETGQGSVWRAEDVEAKLASGMITEAAWLAICAEKAAEERAAWLADPATEGERFAMLRAARDARLAATDYLVAPDYPLSDAQRAAVTAYRQALRDLPAGAGAPWDGGGELTPWPVMPAFKQGQDED